MRISYLGPAGTYSEIAALMYAQSTDILVAQPSMPAVLQAVEQGSADVAVLPIENVLEGSVTVTLDLLIHETALHIHDELVVPISHQLLGRAGTDLATVEVLYGHPQSLGQCRQFIEHTLPHVTTVASLSNSAAPAEALAATRTAVAIGTRRAAELTGASVLVADIQDMAHNVTRFVVLANDDHPPTGEDKTSLCFGFADKDQPGQLVRPIQILSDAAINMIKFESRPSRAVLGEYVFLVDIDGHRLDPHIAAALQNMRLQTGFLKVFGSYPRWSVRSNS
ncbi:MAG: prephenate dehydratase [Roseiflexaceae bacterium]